MKQGKTYKAVKEKAPQEMVAIQEAVAFLKENARTSFDETVELHVRLGIDPKKADQMVRGSVVLPHGTPKKKRIAVFTDDQSKQAEAKEAGADIVGGQELIDEIAKKGNLEADMTVATPDMMPKVARVAKILGPKGLMPNPKTGTVTLEIGKVLSDLSAGKLSFKMDQLGNIHEAIGKISWETDKVVENIEALMEAVRANRPAAQKGEYIKKIVVASTMSPGIRVSLTA